VEQASSQDAQSPLTVGKHPCPECGANLEWSPVRQALACPYCGTVVPWSPAQAADPEAAIVEQDLEAALRDPASGRGWRGERHEVKCQSCQAISVFVEGRVAQRCDFCGSPAILTHESHQDAITPQSVLPFKFSDGQIRERLRKWYGSRWFAPNRLKSAALTDTLRGVYLPYWTFDAHVAARWQADAGYYYYETETFRSDSGQTQVRQVRRVRWEPAAGSLEHFFDDTLVPGTHGVHPGLIRRIEPFPTTTDLKPYAPEFVRGWTVERYQIDLHQAQSVNLDDLGERLRGLCARQVPGDTHRNLQVDATWGGRTFKHVLVPVWLVNYTYGSRTYQVVANGYTGVIAGEQPYSWIKIALAVLVVLVVLAFVAATSQ
jgi:hypothetical protein